MVSTVLMPSPPAMDRSTTSSGNSLRRWPPWKGLFHTEQGAPLVILGQPDLEKLRSTTLTVPNALSFLNLSALEGGGERASTRFRGSLPDNIPLLYYSYHINGGVGTIFIAVMALASLNLWRRRALPSRRCSGCHADVAVPLHGQHRGWITAEVGRQPWLVYGILRHRGWFLPAHLPRQTPCSR